VYDGLYTQSNVAISGTHTHSGPGGYLQYILYIITSLGFVRESFDVLVGGILEVSMFLKQCRSQS
jgi:neutral ceramidase